MFRQSLVILLLCLGCKTEAPEPLKNQYTLNIEISNIKNGVKLYLKKQEDKLTITLDSTVVQNERAIFTGAIQSPHVYGIFIENQPEEGFYPIIEPGTIQIKADIRDLSGAEISGTELNNQLADYKEKAKQISSKMNVLFHEFQKARAENNSNQLKQINMKMQAITTQRNDFSKRFVRSNSESFVASMILHSLLINQNFPRDTISRLYQSLSNDVKQSEFAKIVALELQMDTIRKSD